MGVKERSVVISRTYEYLEYVVILKLFVKKFRDCFPDRRL